MQYTNNGPSQESSSFYNNSDFDQQYLMSASDGRQHTIIDFLERPFPLTNFEWGVSTSQFSTLYSAEFPDAVLAQPLYMDKLNGFLGIRADLKFRLQTNSQPFQAGRLIIAWLPYYKYLGAKSKLFDESGEASFASLTALPHVELDLATETEATLHVPFVSPNTYYNLVTGEGYYGKLYIKVYSPLADVSGSGNVDCTLWFNYCNVRLAFPTGAPTAKNSVNPVAQVGAEESEMEAKRSVSLALAKFSSALRSLPAVPAISSIAEPAAWVSDQASAICKYFGFSKVESSNVPQWLKQGPTHFMANYDGVNMSHSLALESQNAIEAMSGMVGTDIDEMSLSHVTSTPCYYRHFQWSSDQTNGAILYSQIISPLVFVVSENNNTMVPSLLTYASGPFSYWRGSIDLKFKFIKTKFHSGRVRIYFQPGISPNLNSPRANFNYSQVVDLRSEDVVSFRVPYVSTKPWLWLRNSDSANFGYDITGTVFIEVLNELRAVSTVTSSIDVLVEVASGPDFELAGPAQNLLQPVTISSSSTSSLMSRLRAKAQAGDEDTREEEQTPLNKDQLGSKEVFKQIWPNNLFTMGEKVLSIRQLIKRSAYYGSISSPSSGQWVFNPWRMLGTYTRAASDPATPQSFGHLDYFSRIFTFGRGGMNFKIIPQTANQSRAVLRAMVTYPTNTTLNSTSLYQDTSASAVSYLKNGAIQVIINDLEGAYDVTVPHYFNYHMFPLSDLVQDAMNEDLGVFPSLKFSLTNQGQTCDIYRSATDSFQFGYLIGAPRCEFLLSAP